MKLGSILQILNKKDHYLKEFAALRQKTHSYLTDDGDGKQEAKCVIKQRLKFEDYKHCLEATQLVLEKIIKNS